MFEYENVYQVNVFIIQEAPSDQLELFVVFAPIVHQ
jgi:hypothetical protein